MLLKRYAKMGQKKNFQRWKSNWNITFLKQIFFFSFSLFQLVSHFNSLWISTNISHQFPNIFISLTKIWKCDIDLLSLLVQELENLQVLDVVVERWSGFETGIVSSYWMTCSTASAQRTVVWIGEISFLSTWNSWITISSV